MLSYLYPNDEMPIDTGKFLAKAKSYLIKNVKMNFQQEYKLNIIK